MFNLTHATTRHSLPDMYNTLTKLAAYIEKENLNMFIKGRTSGCNIKNAMADGMEVMFSMGSKSELLDAWVDLPDECQLEEEDLEADIDDSFLH